MDNCVISSTTLDHVLDKAFYVCKINLVERRDVANISLQLKKMGSRYYIIIETYAHDSLCYGPVTGKFLNNTIKTIDKLYRQTN